MKNLQQSASGDAFSLALQALQACTVVDASKVVKDEDDASETDDEPDVQTTVPLFVQKLKNLVDDPAIDGATWTTDNASFVIQDPQRLGEQLEKYFKSSKLKSFVRQLHFYGFKKTGGSRRENWVYNHKYFHRDGKLLHRLRRKSCGPEQQIKALKTQVESLQGTLTDTQEKLGNMAVALVNLLHDRMRRDRLEKAKLSGLENKRSSAANPRSRSGIIADPQIQRLTSQTWKRKRSSEPPLPVASSHSVKQARRIPAPLTAMSDVFLNTPSYSFDDTGDSLLELDDFNDEFDDFLLSPQADFEIGRASMIQATA